jgi:hypothetical protein
MAKKYAFVDASGTVVTFTNVSAQVAAENPNVFIEVKDDTLEIGDVVDKKTGSTKNKKQKDTQISRKECREKVRQAMRASDWTQILDTMNNNKRTAWAEYRIALKDNWAVAKVSNDPDKDMVWPVVPGDEYDGL